MLAPPPLYPCPVVLAPPSSPPPLPVQLDQVPMSQVGGLVLIQQQLERLSVHHTLHTLHELLVEAAEERRNADYMGSADSAGPRSPSDSVDGWRLSATAKLVGTR